jgi:hypothetical protein
MLMVNDLTFAAQSVLGETTTSYLLYRLAPIPSKYGPHDILSKAIHFVGNHYYRDRYIVPDTCLHQLYK